VLTQPGPLKIESSPSATASPSGLPASYSITSKVPRGSGRSACGGAFQLRVQTQVLMHRMPYPLCIISSGSAGHQVVRRHCSWARRAAHSLRQDLPLALTHGATLNCQTLCITKCDSAALQCQQAEQYQLRGGHMCLSMNPANKLNSDVQGRKTCCITRGQDQCTAHCHLSVIGLTPPPLTHCV
jgi:hypothetical protein